jgi:hypothetical protein
MALVTGKENEDEDDEPHFMEAQVSSLHCSWSRRILVISR